MTQKKKQRLTLFVGIFAAAAGAVALTLYALRGSVTYFYTPSELAELSEVPSRPIRLGGLVAKDSVNYADADANDNLVTFVVTDGGAEVKVRFDGLLPDLFREGQGVVVQGHMAGDGVMKADTVLAKHDENYMPKEVADALKEQGVWQENE